MKVIDHIKESKTPFFSFEIVPPPRGRSIQDIVNIVKDIAPLQPRWIDVTSHSSTAYFHEKTDGTIERKTFKKRPGTIGICGVIQNRFKIDTVAHLLCLGFSKQETEDALIELSFLGIHNVLALRGDSLNYKKLSRPDRADNEYASDLVAQINDIKKGKYLEDINDCSHLDFCVGVAGYPEKHFEAPNLKSDIENLKKKVEAGAEYIVTQMFFDNQKYFDFVKQAREAGIQVPIVPGLKMIRNLNQLRTLPKSFYIDIPELLSDEMNKNPQHIVEIGKNWMKQQVQGLLSAGVPNVHLYIMNDSQDIVDVLKSI